MDKKPFGGLHPQSEFAERLEPADHLGGSERVAPGEESAAKRRESQGVNHREIDVAGVADEALVESAKRLEQHRHEEPIHDRAIARLARRVGVASDHLGGLVLAAHDPTMRAGFRIPIEARGRLAAELARLDERGITGEASMRSP